MVPVAAPARTAILVGSNAAIPSAIWAALAQAGFCAGAPAGLLVNAEAAPDLAAIAARCLAFAEALPSGQEGLIVTVLARPPSGLAAWQAGATAAGVKQLTRDTALAWGPRHIRVNMIEFLHDTPPEDVAATVLLMTRLPSMTGQTISLDPACVGST